MTTAEKIISRAIARRKAQGFSFEIFAGPDGEPPRSLHYPTRESCDEAAQRWANKGYAIRMLGGA